MRAISSGTGAVWRAIPREMATSVSVALMLIGKLGARPRRWILRGLSMCSGTGNVGTFSNAPSGFRVHLLPQRLTGRHRFRKPFGGNPPGLTPLFEGRSSRAGRVTNSTSKGARLQRGKAPT